MIFVAVPAVLFAVATIAAFAGRWVWWLDLLANFRAQYIPALLVLGVILMVGKWRRTGTAVLLVAVVNVVVVLPLFVGSPGQLTTGAPTVRIMSFNLLSNNQSFSDVFSYIAANHPDLVLLHESSRPWEVAAGAADMGYQVVRTQSEELIFGTLVLVRGDAIVVESFGFATSDPRAVEVSFRPESWPQDLKVLSTHPVSPTGPDSATRAARTALRDAQIGFATDWASAQQGSFIVVGDLNATPWSWPFRNMLARTELRNSQMGFGFQPTFSVDNHPLLRLPIDHLLHSPALGVRDRQLGPPLGSDHFPLVVDLELRG